MPSKLGQKTKNPTKNKNKVFYFFKSCERFIIIFQKKIQSKIDHLNRVE